MSDSAMTPSADVWPPNWCHVASMPTVTGEYRAEW